MCTRTLTNVSLHEGPAATSCCSKWSIHTEVTFTKCHPVPGSPADPLLCLKAAGISCNRNLHLQQTDPAVHIFESTYLSTITLMEKLLLHSLATLLCAKNYQKKLAFMKGERRCGHFSIFTDVNEPCVGVFSASSKLWIKENWIPLPKKLDSQT